MLTRRGQGSLEYLVVSGVALLLVVVSGFFVWESGFLNPEVPRGKMGFYGVEPMDWGASLEDDKVYVVLVNDLDEPVTVDRVGVSLTPRTSCDNETVGVELDPGEQHTVELNCSFSSSGVVLGEYYRADLYVEYTSPSGFEHVSSGEVHGPIEKSDVVVASTTSSSTTSSSTTSSSTTSSSTTSSSTTSSSTTSSSTTSSSTTSSSTTSSSTTSSTILPTLSCSVENGGCAGGETCLLRMSAKGSHAQTCSTGTYPYSVCCTASSGTLGVDCSEGHVLSLESIDNSHVERYHKTSYPVDICLSNSVGTVSCRYSSSCNGDEEAIVSLSDITNAHVSYPGGFSTKVCCKIQ